MTIGVIMSLKNDESESYRLHLKALVKQEQNHAYRRRDYLSHDWHRMDQAHWQSSSLSSSSSSSSVAAVLQHHDNRSSLSASDRMKTMVQNSRRSPSSVGCMIPDDDYDDDSEDTDNIPISSSSSDMMCIRWREKIIEWKYQVIDRFDLSREIVSISTYYLDQYLAKHSVDDELFQLVAMSSIYLAIKIHSPKKITMRSIASTGNGLITVKHIEAMELSIIETLNWYLFPPTCVSFIENLYPLISSHGNPCQFNSYSDMRLVESLEFSRFLAELSVCAYPFISAKPSSIAIAAILFSMEYFNLPEKLRTALRSVTTEVSLDVNTSEVEVCGELLRRVYALAMPLDQPFVVC